MFLSTTKEFRISKWRQFRLSLDELSPDIAALEIAKFWSNAPLVPHYLIIDNVNSWPDPWILISDNIYCDTSVALAMFYTWFYTKHFIESDNISIYDNKPKSEIYNLCLLSEGKYVLNYSVKEVVNKEPVNHLFPKFSYDYVDLKLKK